MKHFRAGIAKIIFALLLAVCVFSESAAQDSEWKGIVRINTADLFINLHNALPGIYATWVPYYILPNLGIPAEIDVHVGWGVLPGVQVSILTGVEYIPIGPKGKDKNGLFLDAKIGLSLFFFEGTAVNIIVKSNIGYQFVTKRGFIASPAAGIVYNGRSGLGLNLMFDLGFAYR